MVLASLVFLMNKGLDNSRQLNEFEYTPPSSGVCFGGPGCNCIGGKVGDQCLLTVVGLVVLLLALCAVVFCACTGACCFAQCIKKPQQVNYVGPYPLQHPGNWPQPPAAVASPVVSDDKV